MKKILAIILVLVIVFALAACNQTKKDNVSQPAQTEQQTNTNNYENSIQWDKEYLSWKQYRGSVTMAEDRTQFIFRTPYLQAEAINENGAMKFFTGGQDRVICYIPQFETENRPLYLTDILNEDFVVFANAFQTAISPDKEVGLRNIESEPASFNYKEYMKYSGEIFTTGEQETTIAYFSGYVTTVANGGYVTFFVVEPVVGNSVGVSAEGTKMASQIAASLG